MAICASVVIVHALLIQEDEDRADPQNDDAEAEETCNFLLTRAYCGSDCGARVRVAERTIHLCGLS